MRRILHVEGYQSAYYYSETVFIREACEQGRDVIILHQLNIWKYAMASTK